MPYKVEGTTVMVKKDGRWRPHKRHNSKKDAQAHARALNANVDHDEEEGES